MFDFGNLRLWFPLAQPSKARLLMVGSLLFLGVASTGCARYQLFFPYVDWIPLRMGCREEKVESCKLLYFQSTITKCKWVMQPISSNASQQGALPEMVRKFASALVPAGIQAMVQEQEKKLWRLIHFSKNVFIFWIVWFVLIVGISIQLPLFFMPRETALATPLALFDLQVGSQPLPIHPSRFAEGWGSSHWRGSQIIELNLASVAVWKTPCEGLLAILECVGTQVWSFDFLGSYAIDSTLPASKLASLKSWPGYDIFTTSSARLPSSLQQ